MKFGLTFSQHNRGRDVSGRSDTWTRAGRKHLPQTHSAASLSLCLSLSFSLSLFLSDTHTKSWTGRDVFSFRKKLLMVPITVILMEIIIIMTVRIIVLILFVFKTPFYFVCLLHVRVTLFRLPSCNSVENVCAFFIFGIKRRKKI